MGQGSEFLDNGMNENLEAIEKSAQKGKKMDSIVNKGVKKGK